MQESTAGPEHVTILQSNMIDLFAYYQDIWVNALDSPCIPCCHLFPKFHSKLDMAMKTPLVIKQEAGGERNTVTLCAMTVVNLSHLWRLVVCPVYACENA